jgi:V/A-type H+-transporting ATPase subunit I
VPPALDALRLDWLAGDDKLAATRHVMLLCFFLGAAHITLAHAWAAVRAGLRPPALAQLGWIATTWCMFFVAKTMVLGDAFPAVMVPVTIAGVVAIVLFMTPKKQLRDEWFNHVMLPLNLVSNFVDVVSYLRLFAVGTAGVAVASAFNEMAARLGAAGGPSTVAAVLVAVFGHALNLVLCAMGVLVHGVRLNTLEFSAHLGLQWSGVPYRPLQRRAPAAEAVGDVDG